MQIGKESIWLNPSYLRLRIRTNRDQVFNPNESEVGSTLIDSYWELSLNYSDLGFIRIESIGLNRIGFWLGIKISY